jgi:hypothetical protein
MGVYYVIRDNERLRTIHSVKDSAEAAFNQLVKKEGGPDVLEIVCVTTDQFGSVRKCMLIATWTRRSGVIITHMSDITTEYLLV